MENSLESLSLLSRMALPTTQELRFVATHFFDFRRSDLISLPFEVMRSVLSSNSFPSDRDEDLFTVLEAGTPTNPRYFDLFEFVSFEKLTVQTMSRFIHLTQSLGQTISLSSGVWQSLCHRLLQGPAEPARERMRVSALPLRVIEFDASRPLLGIVTFLSQSSGLKGAVTVSASTHFSTRVPENIVKFDESLYFYSENEPNQWIGYEFLAHLVTPNMYTLQTRQYGGRCHVQSWVIEGSQDGLEWTEMDRQSDVAEMDEQAFVKSFATARPMPCKFVRLRQTGPNSNGRNELSLARFELFGELHEAKSG